MTFRGFSYNQRLILLEFTSIARQISACYDNSVRKLWRKIIMMLKTYFNDIKTCTNSKYVSYIFLRVAQALCPTLITLVLAYFIDTLFADVFSLHNSLFGLFLVLTIIAGSKLTEVLTEVQKENLELLCTVFFKRKISLKISTLPFTFLEDVSVLDLIKRTKENVGERTSGFIIELLSLLSYGVKISGIIFLVGSHLWWVAVFILIILSLFLVISFKSGQTEYAVFEEAETYIRRSEAMSDILKKKEYVLERKLYHYADFIHERFNSAYETGRKKEQDAFVKSFSKSGLMTLLTILFSFSCVFLLIFPVASQNMSVGTYIALTTNILSLIEQMSWELSVLMVNFTKDRLYLKDLYHLFALTNEAQKTCYSPLPDTIQSIELKDITFYYPHEKTPILNHLSFKLEAGKSYALIGENGTGKSTLIKLLAGLYTHYNGDILLNTNNIQNYSSKDRGKLFHFVFQNFAHYQLSIREFLSLGGTHKTDADLQDALNYVGLQNEFSALPNGLDTKLGKIYADGLDLSGGQWQKLALARSFLSDASILILDEPTAALDPLTEKEVYKTYQTLARERHFILFMISHRLGCIQDADEILVISNGHITEHGNHKQLLNQGGIYHQMYHTQKEWYYET